MLYLPGTYPVSAEVGRWLGVGHMHQAMHSMVTPVLIVETQDISSWNITR